MSFPYIPRLSHMAKLKEELVLLEVVDGSDPANHRILAGFQVLLS